MSVITLQQEFHPSEIVRINTDEYCSYLSEITAVDSFRAVHSEIASERPRTVKKRKRLQQTDKDTHDDDWRGKVQIAVDYEEHYFDFLKYTEVLAKI